MQTGRFTFADCDLTSSCISSVLTFCPGPLYYAAEVYLKTEL